MHLKDFYANTPTAEQVKLLDDLAAEIISEVPPSPHRTVALRKLLESKMTLIHGITHPIE